MWNAGMQWVRIDVGWASLEPNQKGSYDFALNDKCVSMATSRGFHVLETLWMTPGWANGGQSVYTPPTNMNDYGDIAQTVAARYDGTHGVGKVDAWEVWNEPDPSQSAWAGTTADYVNLVKASYARFHAGSSGVQVVVGGPASNRTWYINQLYLNGLTGAYFDVISVHPYEAPSTAQPPEAPNGDATDCCPGVYDWPGDGYITHTPTLHSLMVAHGDGAKVIWWTEFGWSTCTGSSECVSKATQGDYTVRAIKLARANYPWVTNVFVYDARDDSSDTSSWGDNHGLLHYDLSPKAAYTAISNYLHGL